jgi:hypothetical protein
LCDIPHTKSFGFHADVVWVTWKYTQGTRASSKAYAEDGFARYLAAKQLGWKTINPTVMTDGEWKKK